MTVSTTTTSTAAQKVWFITGTTNNSLGWYLAYYALSRGDLVIGSSRRPTSIHGLPHSENFTPIHLDLLHPDPACHFQTVVTTALSLHGRIDVLILNAGGVICGGIEEISPSQLSTHFQLNVFSQHHLARLFLPHFREKKSGIIAFVGSIAGWASTPGWGFYCAGKAALVTMGQALAKEVEPIGITVTVIEPGTFRTGLLRLSGNVVIAEDKGKFQEYYSPGDENGKGKGVLVGMWELLDGLNGNQPGDPLKGALLIVEGLLMEGRFEKWKKEGGIPRRWAVGDDAEPWIMAGKGEEEGMLERWVGLTNGTSFGPEIPSIGAS